MPDTYDKTTTLHAALGSRSLSIGTWMQLASPTVAEIIDASSCDWVAVDCEHTDIGLREFSAVARGLRHTSPLVRVESADILVIRRYLDCGAAGVVVPLVETPEIAEQAVRAARFPPEGIRGFSYSRANRHGLEFDSYAARANDETVVVVMIESRRGAEAAEEIASVEGVSALFIGPYDMSGSYGILGEVDHPVMRDAAATIARACRHNGKSAGMHIVHPTADRVSAAVEDGYTFLALGMDTVFVADGIKSACDLIKPRRSSA